MRTSERIPLRALQEEEEEKERERERERKRKERNIITKYIHG